MCAVYAQVHSYADRAMCRFRDAAQRFYSQGSRTEHLYRWSGIRADRLSSHPGEFCKLFCGISSRHLDLFIDDVDFSQLFNMILMLLTCTAFLDKDAFLSLFGVTHGEAVPDNLPSALGAVRNAANSARQLRTKLAHDMLTLDASDFDYLVSCSRQLLEGVCSIFSCISDDSDFTFPRCARDAFASIEAMGKCEFQALALSDDKLEVSIRQQRQMLGERGPVQEENVTHIAAAISSLGPEYEKYASSIIWQGIDGPFVALLLDPSRSDDLNPFIAELGATTVVHRTRLRALFDAMYPRVAPVNGFSLTQEKALWMKACLILEACLKGVRPFVGSVMERLHKRVIEMVQQDVMRDFGACEVEDWDCSTCGDAAHDTFTEDGPVVLNIRAMDANGVADCGVSHYLKPRIVTPCRLKNIPAGYFPDADAISPSLPLLLCPNPADINNPKCSTFILSHKTNLDSSTQHLTPFLVTRCWPSEPALEFHAVLCSSRPGNTDQLVNAFLSQKHLPKAHSTSGISFGFWALTKNNFTRDGTDFSEFKQLSISSISKHGLKQGHILRFDGRDLPPGIMRGGRYVVIVSRTFSFNVCGPIVCPVLPMTAEAFGADGLPLVIRTSPVVR